MISNVILRGFHQMLKWNVKGDADTYVILWIGTIIAVLIVSYWFFGKVQPISKESRLIGDTLDNFKNEFNIACNSLVYQVKVNPSLEKGIFYNNYSKICIKSKNLNSTTCRTAICNISTSFSFDLSKIIDIIILKNGSNFNVTSN